MEKSQQLSRQKHYICLHGEVKVMCIRRYISFHKPNLTANFPPRFPRAHLPMSWLLLVCLAGNPLQISNYRLYSKRNKKGVEAPEDSLNSKFLIVGSLSSSSTMPQGKLQVLLVTAKGLDGADFLSNVDPYAVLTCRTQEHKSSVASGNGSNPEWNENFIFTISSSVSQLNIKIFDKDSFTEDDFLGEAEIPLEPAFAEGELPVTAYNVVKEGEYCGEIKLSLTFTPEERDDRDLPVEALGGWKDSDVSYA